MLRELYRDYLQAGAEPAAAAPLARALAATPLADTAQLLHDYARGGAGSYPIAAGDRTGPHAFVGAHPPSAGLGARWLDVVDLSLSVLVPAYVDPDDRDALAPEAVARVARDTRWFPLRAVSRLGFGGFLDVAAIERARPDVLDPARITAGAALDAVTSLRPGEVALYLYWIGKSFTDVHSWRSARAYLPAVPWAVPSREWAGPADDPDYLEVVGPDTLDVDPDDAAALTGASRVLYRPSEAPSDVTFRALVASVWGLRTAPVPSEAIGGARVLARFARPG